MSVISQIDGLMIAFSDGSQSPVGGSARLEIAQNRS